MGNDLIGDAIIYLHANEIWAHRGYPGRLMPHVTEPAVAINLHKYTPEGVTVVAEVCAPMDKGVYACEDLAERICKVWEERGAAVTYGSHRFDGKSGLYMMSVYGTWLRETEETTEDTSTQ